jgi:hypothetical protein
MLKIDWIQDCVRKGEYYFSKHGDQERQNDNLTVEDVEEALTTGRILEQYGDTGRGESCLVGGFTEGGTPVHAVCGKRGDWLAVITVYVPRPPRFKTPLERSKK